MRLDPNWRAILRRAWINLDAIWTAALAATGALLVLS